MASNEPAIDAVAAAILDGSSVDWDAADSTADLAERPLLDQFRVLAAVADLHRHAAAEARPSVASALGSGTLVSRPGETAVPHEWAHLRVLEPIGRGAFGIVYRAWDTRLDREVALKLLPAPDAQLADDTRSIIHEGRLLARVRHPNVVTIYGAERIDNRIGLWMELIRGRTLQHLIAQERKRFGATEAIDIGIQLGRAVEAVHKAGLLHRDVKAHNVMVADDGRIVLMDFGTGREMSDVSAAAAAGTPLYLAPEIFQGQLFGRLAHGSRRHREHPPRFWPVWDCSRRQPRQPATEDHPLSPCYR